MSIRIDVCVNGQLGPADLDEWEKLRRLVHPPTEPRLGSDLTWAELEPTDQIVRLWDEDELRACAWVTERAVMIAGSEIRVAGIRGVMTHPDHRRRGYGRVVMERATELMRERDADFALLFSSTMAVPFYESLGWRTIPGPVFCQQPDGRIDYGQRIPAPVMAFPLRRSELPAGLIDIRGAPW